MNSAHWRRIKSIMQQALELPPEEWPGFLDDACGSDDRIRLEVDSLLAAHREISDRESYWVGRSDEPRRIDRYEILRPLDRGGMGVVYLASQLEPIRRQVAIKLIKSGMDTGELLARFKVERQALASLSHPNIARMLDAGSTAEGRPYFVMEYVPGLPITDFCRTHRLDLKGRYRLLADVLSALQHAHEAGIVHRDLKPSNVLVMLQDGKPVTKIIDFGVAKADSTLSKNEARLTQVGQIIGTPEYMSPEQANGRPVDARTDLWSVGCLLFQLLSGRSAFGGGSVGETIAAVLGRNPDWGLLPADVHPAARRLMRRCLAKDPEQRLRSAADASLELHEAIAGGDASDEEHRRRRWHWAVPWAILAVALVGMSAWCNVAPRRGERHDRSSRRLRLAIPGPHTQQSDAPVLSPDGSSFVYAQEDGLYLHRFDRLDALPLTGTAGAGHPFWSPDGLWIGYFTTTAIRRVPVAGGSGATIIELGGEVVGGAGAAWTVDDMIVYSRGDTELFEVPARGGARRVRYESETYEHFHAPSLLSDGRSLVFGAHAARTVDLLVLVDGEARVLQHVDSHKLDYPVWAPSGHILYQRTPTNAGLWAIPISPEMVRTGRPFFVAAGGGFPSVAHDGTLLYVPSAVSERVELVWVDRDGRLLDRTGISGVELRFPELSPEGSRVLLAERRRDRYDVWVHDLELSTHVRLTSGEARFYFARWAPDGRTVYGHGSATDERANSFIWRASVDGRSPEEVVVPGGFPALSSDGRRLIHTDYGGTAGGGANLRHRSVSAPEESIPFAISPFEETLPEFSPDNRFVAYTSNESGVYETWIARYPEGTPKWQVTRGGGRGARWSAAGDRIFYVNRGRLLEVEVTTSPRVEIHPARELFSGTGRRLLVDAMWGFDVDDEGNRFLMLRPQVSEEDAGTVVLVDDWFEEFRDDAQ